MRFRLLVASALALFAIAAPSPCEARQSFSITSIKATVESDTVRIRVSMKGTPPDPKDLEIAANWQVDLVGDNGSVGIASTAIKPEVHAADKLVFLVFPVSAAGAPNPEASGWIVAFRHGTSSAFGMADPPSNARFKAAADKDDATLYAFGSVLVGPHTKAVWIVDAKAEHEFERKDGTPGWKWKLAGAFNINDGEEAPADDINVNPDAISFSAGLTKNVSVARRSTWLSGVEYSFKLAEGEFTRKTRVGAVVSTGGLELHLKPIGRLALRPSIGYELGHAVVRPTKISEIDVDLSGWNAIARGLAQISADWTLFKAKPTADDLSIVVISGSYSGRFLATNEPLSQRGTSDGKRAIVTTLSKEPRRHAEAELDWNISKYTGLAVKYQYGSAPPLFAVTDHQFTIGVTIKSKAAK